MAADSAPQTQENPLLGFVKDASFEIGNLWRRNEALSKQLQKAAIDIEHSEAELKITKNHIKEARAQLHDAQVIIESTQRAFAAYMQLLVSTKPEDMIAAASATGFAKALFTAPMLSSNESKEQASAPPLLVDIDEEPSASVGATPLLPAHGEVDLLMNEPVLNEETTLTVSLVGLSSTVPTIQQNLVIPDCQPQSAPLDKSESVPLDKLESAPLDRSESALLGKSKSAPLDKSKSAPLDKPKAAPLDKSKAAPVKTRQRTRIMAAAMRETEALGKSHRIGPADYFTKDYQPEYSDDWHIKMKCPELYFTFGVRYQPVIQDMKCMRVVISPLPLDITYGELLAQVRGDIIVSCEILDALPQIHYNCKSALVRFKTEAGALAYIRFTRNHPLNFRGEVPSVELIPTLTYPLPKRTAISVYKNDLTRVLRLRNIPRRITRDRLLADIAKAAGLNSFRKHPIVTAYDYEKFPCSVSTNERLPVGTGWSIRAEHAGADHHNTLKGTDEWGTWPLECMHSFSDIRNNRHIELRFTSVDFAGRAYGIMTGFRAYDGATVNYGPDPCAGPLAELLPTSKQVHNE